MCSLSSRPEACLWVKLFAHVLCPLVDISERHSHSPDAEGSGGNSCSPSRMESEEIIAMHPRPVSPKRRAAQSRRPVADALTDSAALKRTSKYCSLGTEQHASMSVPSSTRAARASLQKFSSTAESPQAQAGSQSSARTLHVSVTAGVLSAHQFEAFCQGCIRQPCAPPPRQLTSQWVPSLPSHGQRETCSAAPGEMPAALIPYTL
jgi:hypothetical protein